MARPEVTGKKYLRRGELAERYKVDLRTIDRWYKEDGRLPKPDLVMARSPMWSEGLIEANERSAMRGHR
jgi:hypothetical protein